MSPRFPTSPKHRRRRACYTRSATTYLRLLSASTSHQQRRRCHCCRATRRSRKRLQFRVALAPSACRVFAPKAFVVPLRTRRTPDTAHLERCSGCASRHLRKVRLRRESQLGNEPSATQQACDVTKELRASLLRSAAKRAVAIQIKRSRFLPCDGAGRIAVCVEPEETPDKDSSANATSVAD